MKRQASEMGLDLIEVDNKEAFSEIIKTSGFPRLSDEQAHLFAHNLSKASEKIYLTRLFNHMQWVMQTLNRLEIGFMISDGYNPFVMNATASYILQKDPKQIDYHPIREAVTEDHQEALYKAIKQLASGAIRQYREDIQIQTPMQKNKNLQIHGKYLEMNGLPLIAEYIAENSPGQPKPSQNLKFIPSLVPELHRILTGICGVINLLYLKEEASSKQIKKETSGEPFHLTRREKQILQYIYEGYTSQKIAEKLYISKRTVESHRANILHKTNAKNTADLIRFALHHKLL